MSRKTGQHLPGKYTVLALMDYYIPAHKAGGPIRTVANIVERLGDANWKRMRQYNVFVNFLLIIGSLCWNLAHLIPILRLRYNSNKFLKKD